MRLFFATHRFLFYGLLLALLLGAAVLLGRGCQARQHDTETADLRLHLALRDSLRTSVDQEGRTRYEKETLQGQLRTVLAEKAALNAQQQALLATVAALQKAQAHTQQQLIAAGSVAQVAGSDKPLAPVVAATDTSAQTLRFALKSEFISYRARVSHARASGGQPALELESLQLPNVATVAFSWDESRPGVPVAFSVTNSNPLFKVTGLESYAIPDLRPALVQPRGWRKVLVVGGHVLKYGVPTLLIGGLVGVAVAR